MKPKQRGLFITFEGCDGCGKTSQLELCYEYLVAKGYEVIKTREPGAMELGKKIREILLHHEQAISPTAETFLFLADRANHIDMLIKPSVEEGKIVLCDRHTDSTIAYQGYGRSKDLKQIVELNNLATGGLAPDLTLLFDVDLEISKQRVGTTKDRMESAGDEFHEKVRLGYLKLAQEDPKRVKVVNANLPIDDVFRLVVELVSAKFGE